MKERLLLMNELYLETLLAMYETANLQIIIEGGEVVDYWFGDDDDE